MQDRLSNAKSKGAIRSRKGSYQLEVVCHVMSKAVGIGIYLGLAHVKFTDRR